MKKINPWTWQDQFGFSQAILVDGAHRTVYCAGQPSTDADGNPVNAGDMSAQISKCLDNLEEVLAAPGLTLNDVVRLNYYTVNIPAFMEAIGGCVERLSAQDCQPSSTLLGISSLFHPDVLVEIEATAIGKA